VALASAGQVKGVAVAKNVAGNVARNVAWKTVNWRRVCRDQENKGRFGWHFLAWLRFKQ
jgi:hypothetical protein